jgi:phosphatidylinositol phospholipase C delta
VEKQPSFSEPLSTDSTSSTESDSGLARLARRLSIGTSKEKPSFSQSLLDLLLYTEGVKYQGFTKLVEYSPHQQFSVSERTGSKIIRENKGDWIKHNFTHISRVYPKGFRLGSSNYNPVPFWAAGNQIVALNWQTIGESYLPEPCYALSAGAHALDEATKLNHALFADSQGYVLKPPALRSKLQEPVKRHRIRLQVISAQRLPISSDLFVEARISHGDAEVPPPKRTDVIKGKALNPIWDHQLCFEIDTTASMLALTFLHLEIKNKSLLAQWARPITMAPRGYHHLPLYDPLFSRYVFATLFVRIDVDVLNDAT